MAEANVLNTVEDIITCALCREVLVDPKTFTCLHSFCKGCVQSLELVKDEDVEGYKCPLCRRFTPKTDVRVVHLIVQLLDSYHAAKGTQKTPKCTHCPTKAARWHCMECKQQSLCDYCKSHHDKYVEHHVVSIEELKSQSFVSDGPVFCDEHKKYELEVYCTNCRKALCVMCKVLYHDDHKAQPIADAIKELLPILDEKKAKIDTNIVQNNNQITALKEKKTVEVTEIESDIKKLEDKKKTTIKNYEHEIETVQDKVTEARQVKRWLETTLSRTRGASLMKELQDGLLNKLDEMALHEKDLVQHYYVSRSWPWSLENIPNVLKTTITLETVGGSYPYTRFAMLWNMICVFDHPNRKMIRYQFDGKQLKTVQFPKTIVQPRTAIQLSETESVLVCKSGLLLFNENGEIIDTIATGDYSDAAESRDLLYALEQGKEKLICFKRQMNAFTILSEILLEGYEARNAVYNFCDSFMIINETIILALNRSHKVVCYDMNGQKSSTKYSSFENGSCVSVCGVGADNRVLLASYSGKCLDVLNTDGTKRTLLKIKANAWFALYKDQHTLWVLDDSCTLRCYVTK